MSAHENIFDAPPTDPMSVFDAWLAEAGDSEPNDPNAMTLATVDADGMPSKSLRTMAVPFGPGLAVGTLIVVLFPDLVL